VAPADRLPVKRLNRFRSSAGVRHLDEAESLGLARELIRNDRGRRHFAECGERRLELLVGHARGKIAKIDINKLTWSLDDRIDGKPLVARLDPRVARRFIARTG